VEWITNILAVSLVIGRTPIEIKNPLLRLQQGIFFYFLPVILLLIVMVQQQLFLQL